MKEKVLATLYEVVDEINLQLDKHEKIEKKPTTPLIGENSHLDSLLLVNFISTTEEKIEEYFEVEIYLTEDEELIFSETGPLKTVESLSDFITEKMR